MFSIYLHQPNFEYDVNALVKSFFPEEEVALFTPETKAEKQAAYRPHQQMALDFSAPFVDIFAFGNTYRARYEGEEAGYKMWAKQFLYHTLSQITDKTLPWGNLTGIRPTKIAYGLLLEGKSDAEILRYYQETHATSIEKALLSIDIAKREQALLKKLHCGDFSADKKAGYSLYIGIAFCPSTCLYCSFTSYPIAAYRKKTENYLAALLKEMDSVSAQLKDCVLDTVYIGGGTPTTLEAEQLDRLLGALKERFDFSTVQEFCVEAGRADSITREKLEVLKKHGVDRISVNPQTFKQETLDIIGRKASVEQVLAAYETAREVGFDNINMDIILGLPGESERDVAEITMEQILALKPESLTVHSLAIKRASHIHRWIEEHGVQSLSNTDKTMEIARQGAARLGLNPYYLYRQKNMAGNFENVGYAAPGKESLYNIVIMEEKQTIVALGAGAITKAVWKTGRIERCDGLKDVDQYMSRIDETIEKKKALLARWLQENGA